MVTYQIQIPEAKQEAFLNIIKSLQSLGVVEKFHVSDNLTQPGESISIEQLLTILDESEKQVEAGHSISSDEVISYMKAWKQSKK